MWFCRFFSVRELEECSLAMLAGVATLLGVRTLEAGWLALLGMGHRGPSLDGPAMLLLQDLELE